MDHSDCCLTNDKNDMDSFWFYQCAIACFYFYGIGMMWGVWAQQCVTETFLLVPYCNCKQSGVLSKVVV